MYVSHKRADAWREPFPLHATSCLSSRRNRFLSLSLSLRRPTSAAAPPHLPARPTDRPPVRPSTRPSAALGYLGPHRPARVVTDDGEDEDRKSGDETARFCTILLTITMNSPVTVGNGNERITSTESPFSTLHLSPTDFDCIEGFDHCYIPSIGRQDHFLV